MQHAIAAVLAVLFLGAGNAAVAASGPYPETTRAKADLEDALKTAARQGKRVLVDFGGNWCPDCKVLDINLRKPENAAILERGFVLVHVNVGEKGVTDNLDLGERYGIPLKKGVPALAVLEPDGRVVFAHRNGEFESMRKMDPKAVTEFLQQWKPK
jgi:thioredoxin 1